MIEAARKSTDFLAAVVAIQRQFIADADPCAAFDRALELLLELSESKLGFIGEVLNSSEGQPYLRIQSFRGIDLEDADARFYEEFAPAGLEFRNLRTLMGEAVRTGDFVISNAPETDPRSSGLPPGHPPLDSYLGMPLFSATGVQVGLAGLANRVLGYNGALIEILQPVCDALGVMIDAAQRGRTRLAEEAAVKAEESRYRRFVDHATDGIFLHDRTGRVLDVNRQACESLGYERHELIGMLPFAFDPAVTQEHIEEIARRLDEGETFAFESRHRRKDGSTFPVEIRVRPFWVDGARQSLAIARDITERKRVEERLRESEARMRTVLESLDRVAVQAYEPDGTITFWNKASENFYGYSAAEVMGRDLVELLHGEATRDAERRIMAEALQTGEPMAADEVDVVRRDGSKITVFASRIVHPRPGKSPEFFCFDVDITERKRAEEAIQEQYAILHTVLESTSDYIYMKDPQGRYLMINSAGAAAVGKAVDEIIGRDDTAIFSPEVARELMEFDRRIFADGGTQRFDETMLIGDQLLHLSTAKSACRDSNGNVIGLVGITRDVTASVQALQALHETQQRLTIILKGADVGLWDWDLTTNATEFSDEWKSQLGYASHEIESRFEEWESRVHPDDLPATLEKLTDARERCAADYAAEFRMRHKDGSWRWILSLGFTIPGPDGKAARMLGVHLDVTDRKQAEEALKESEKRSRLALDVADLGTWRHDFDSNVVHLDARAQSLWGFDQPRVDASEMIDRIHSEDVGKLLDQFAGIVGTGSDECLAGEFRIHSPDGEVRWIALRGRVDSASDGAIRQPMRSIGTYLDITERKRIEAERERLHQEIVASRERLKGMSRRIIEAQESERRHLALELHDEIGQVLTTVNMSLESLRSRIDPTYLRRLDDSVRVVNMAIDQVRELSLNLRPASLDILGLEAALRAYALRQGDRAGLVVEVESALDGRRLPPMLETVCFRVAQESLTNVLRHAQASHCWISLKLNREIIQVEIRDDGIGFDASDAHRRALSGEGSGLLGMRERVQVFGGHLDVHSAMGSGTTILARLPLVLAHLPAATEFQP